VHEARRALGLRLRELRRIAGLTGQQLAESLAWPPSKISKLENGRQTPTDEDLRAWTTATDTEPEADGLLESLHTLELQHAEWSRVLRSGLRTHQKELYEQDERIQLFRAFDGATIPGLLQTAEYARTRFEEQILTHPGPTDIDEAVRLRMQRQDVLYRQDKSFHFVITEAALRYRRCPMEVHLAQLDRLVALSALRNVRLGVIGFETEYRIGPRHGFWLLDDTLVTIETYSAELNLAQPQEIELYSQVFDELAAVASYGGAARAILVRVIDSLTPALPE
jgi:transcriptional regulator with XRE-family HTH domain